MLYIVLFSLVRHFFANYKSQNSLCYMANLNIFQNFDNPLQKIYHKFSNKKLYLYRKT